MKNRLSIFIIVILSLVVLVSCDKVKVYEKTDCMDYVKALYGYMNKEDSRYVAIDLRPLRPDYAEGHIKGFKNFHFKIAVKDDFITYMKSMYSKKTAIFLLDESGEDVLVAASHLKGVGYKNIYIYTGGYEDLRNNSTDYLYVATGTDDCGC